MSTRRTRLKPEMEGDRQRLRALWNSYQAASGASQEDFAALAGISQSGFNHYLTGRKPLGLDAVLRFARLFEVSPADISPSLAVNYLSLLLGGPRTPVAAAQEGSPAAYSQPQLSAGEAALIYETRRLAQRLGSTPEEMARKIISLMRMLVVNPIPDSALDPAWDASTREEEPSPSRSSP